MSDFETVRVAYDDVARKGRARIFGRREADRQAADLVWETFLAKSLSDEDLFRAFYCGVGEGADRRWRLLLNDLRGAYEEGNATPEQRRLWDYLGLSNTFGNAQEGGDDDVWTFMCNDPVTQFYFQSVLADISGKPQVSR